MKQLLVLFFFLTSFSIYAQDTECIAPKLTKKQEQLMLKLGQQGVANSARVLADGNVRLAVTAHLIGKNDGSGVLSKQQIRNALVNASDNLSEAGLSFAVTEFNYINNSNYYNFSSTQEEALRAEHYRENTINIYFVNSLVADGSSVCGYAYLPGGPDLVMMRNSCTTGGKTLSHELGHFFGLEHTFETRHGVELVVRTGEESENCKEPDCTPLAPNCDTAGDLVCDTPADRLGIQDNLNSLCEYTGTATDDNGDPFDPDTRNIMSYRSNSCRNRFSPGQYERMTAAYTIAKFHLREESDILTFSVAEQIIPAILDRSNHSITVLLAEGTDMTNLLPEITVGIDVSISPASATPIDLSSPATYIVTASDGSTQDWTVRGEIARPFTTSWQLASGEALSLPLHDAYDYDFLYAWVQEGDTLIHGTHSSADGAFAFTPSADGVYQLEILGDFAYFFGYPKEQLLDVEQWGHVFWRDMNGSFQNWPGTLSAADAPILTEVNNMSSMFQNATNFNSDLSAWDVSTVTRMINLFRDAQSFNGDLSTWDVSRVTTMNSMFKGAISFNQEIGDWNVGLVTDMRDMLNSAISFDQDISGWDVSSVRNFQGLFVNVVDFNSDISSWNTQSAENMSYMFQRVESFNQDISGWNTASVTNFQGTFSGASSFDQDLSSWDVGQVEDMKFMFNGSGLSTSNYDEILMAWAEQQLSLGIELGAEGVSYCRAAEARNSLIENLGWTIKDEGSSCSEEAELLSFELEGQLAGAQIDAAAQRILLELEPGTDLSKLSPVLTLSEGASSDPGSGESVDFTSPVTYTVTAENGVTSKEWLVTVTSQAVLGVLAREWSIFPNPTSGWLHIKGIGEAKYYLTDLSGQKILEPSEGRNGLDLTTLENGIYLLIIQGEGGVLTRKIIKN